MAKALTEIVGDVIVNGSGQEVSAEDICQPGSVVGLYFSAHWCAPCRDFNPVLSDYYKNLRKKGERFEIIFISCDHAEKE